MIGELVAAGVIVAIIVGSMIKLGMIIFDDDHEPYDDGEN